MKVNVYRIEAMGEIECDNISDALIAAEVGDIHFNLAPNQKFMAIQQDKKIMADNATENVTITRPRNFPVKNPPRDHEPHIPPTMPTNTHGLDNPGDIDNG